MGGSQSYSLTATPQWYLEGRRLYGLTGFQAASTSFYKSDLGDMSGKVVAITGANKGLGFAAAAQIAEHDAEIHLLCRDLAKAEEARAKIGKNKKVFCHQLDVSNFKDVKAFAERFKGNLV
jgi:dehydrogenase/reductase SDR family protein 12